MILRRGGLGLGLGLGLGYAGAGRSAFTSTWKTDNTSVGSSANNQVSLPLVSGGTYNMNVSWGDGSSSTITAWDQAEKTHTYGSIGTYVVTITGICTGWQFNNTLDKLKLLDISSFGPLALTNVPGGFYGCVNMTITATDIFSGIGGTTLAECFAFCSSITSIPGLPKIDTSAATNFISMFFNCINFNYPLDGLDTSNATIMTSMFNGCTAFNHPVSSLDTSSVTQMSGILAGCLAFNQPLSSWDTSLVQNASYMLYNAQAFNQSLASFSIASMINMDAILALTAFSTTNYDATLNSWGPQSKQPNVPFHAGTATYSAGTPAANRAILVTAGWTITDGGPA